jgi:flavin reductase (DIM6/NTAB) family NADH-FMN oxidoreductase RutF
MRTEGTREHLVFVWTPAGYALEVRSGEPPPLGAAVADGERSHLVAKVAASPLPGDARACAYLLPGETLPVAEARENGNHEPTADTIEVAPMLAEHVRAEGTGRVADDLLTLLGEFPEGTCVVTVDAEGRRLGLTIGTLVSLSSDPPLVGFTMPNEELMTGLLPVAGGCVISILAGGQEWLARHFETSERPIAMWHGLGAEPGAAGAPLFVGALGWFECVLLDRADLGSHTLFVCEVREAEASMEAPALARVRGRFETV